MKVGYYGKHNRKGSDATESHIATALKELGHEVVCFSPWDETPKVDVMLFHKDLPPGDTPAICWYFDKVDFYDTRPPYIAKALARSELVFLTDETWTKNHPHEKFRVLRQGIGDPELGEKIELNAKVGFTGSLYGSRFEFCQRLSTEFGDGFYVFNGVNNRDFNNLCATVPVLVAPQSPSDDYYWSNRVYITLGSGGFLLHPRLKGLEEEYIDGEDIVFYDTLDDLVGKAHYYLENTEERERIRMNGWKKTKEKYTYKKRVESLMKEYETHRQRH